jgi:hypothetical protein
VCPDTRQYTPRDRVSTQPEIVFVDHLCYASMLRVLALRVRAPSRRHPLMVRCFPSQGRMSRPISILARVIGLDLQELSYSLEEVKDADGGFSSVRAVGSDLAHCIEVGLSADFRLQRVLAQSEKRFGGDRLFVYMKKCLAMEILPLLVQIRVVDWFCRGEEKSSVRFLLGSYRCRWKGAVRNSASERAIQVSFYRKFPSLSALRGVPRRTRSVLRAVFTIFGRILRRVWNARTRDSAEALSPGSDGDVQDVESGLRVAVECTGKGIRLDSSWNSDLFWLPHARLRRGALLLCFTQSGDQLDAEKSAVAEELGASTIALNSGVAAVSSTSTWNYNDSLWDRLRTVFMLFVYFLKAVKWAAPLEPGLFRYLARFGIEYGYWYNFFRSQGVGIYLSFYEGAPQRAALDQALADLGGISISYQRSEESFILPLLASTAHVHFLFSQGQVAIERTLGSRVVCYVVSGYVHDHAFSRVGKRSAERRSRLLSAGAQFIVCYFDENSTDDPTIGVSHGSAASNYAFLLRKLLEDETLGLILKPKKPQRIRAILESQGIGGLLDEALSTGRCVLISDGVVSTATLPCEAALAADLAIGKGTTATVESALAGARAVFIDRERIYDHPFYRESSEGIIFNDWESLWTDLCNHRKGGQAHSSRFGDWSSLLPKIDPYRDGLAAQRMGTFIGDLKEVLDVERSVDDALEEATKNYRRKHGDKSVRMWDDPC